MSDVRQTCDTCENAIFCPTWTEYKCKAFSRRNVYKPDEPNNCKKYVKKKSKEEPTCHCDDCEAVRSLEELE